MAVAEAEADLGHIPGAVAELDQRIVGHGEIHAERRFQGLFIGGVSDLQESALAVIALADSHALVGELQGLRRAVFKGHDDGAEAFDRHQSRRCIAAFRGRGREGDFLRVGSADFDLEGDGACVGDGFLDVVSLGQDCPDDLLVVKSFHSEGLAQAVQGNFCEARVNVVGIMGQADGVADFIVPGQGEGQFRVGFDPGHLLNQGLVLTAQGDPCVVQAVL